MSLSSAALGISCAHAEGVGQYVNPLDVFLGDPFVLLHDGTYYLYATSAGNGFKVWSSPDIVNWTYQRMAYTAGPSSYGKANFWAPEVLFRNEQFYMHYTAQGADGILRLCVATSPSPLGPFQDAAAPMFDTGDGKAWIDGDVFFDDDGTAYLYVVKDYSRNNNKSQVFVAKLKPNLTELDGDLTFCIEPIGGWEGTGWNEGPFALKHNGTYYLMYSGNFYRNSDYAVGYATSSSPLGPWAKYSGNPILKKVAGKVSGPGHHCVTRSIDGSEMLICYHTHQSFAGGGARQLAIDRLEFAPNPAGGADILRVPTGPSSTAQSFPSGNPLFPHGASDEFGNITLDRSRWLAFGEDPAKWGFLSPGQLTITTQGGDIWTTNTGEAKNIFLQYAPESDFEISTSLAFLPNANFEQAFLIIWQDHNNYLRLSSAFSDGRKFEVAREINGRVTGLTQVANTIGTNVFLKIVRRGNLFRFFYGADAQTWTEIGEGFPADLLETKVGFGAISPGSKAAVNAVFDYFRIKELPPANANPAAWSGYR